MIAHKTKATMPGRLSHTSLPKHHQVIRFASGVQNLSTPILGGTNPLETASCIYPTSNRNKANSFGVVQTKHRDSPSLPVRRAGSRVNKDEQYSGSSEYKHCLGSVVIQHGCNNENQQVITCSQLSRVALVKLNQQVTGKEKGSAENTTLEMVPLLIHEENQRSPALDCKIKHDSSNLRNEINQHLVEQHVRTCETFVGQPFGTQRALNWRLIPFSCLLNSCLISSSSEFNASNLSGNPLLLISFTAASSSSGLLNSVGKMLSVFPVIKATLCLHNTVAGQSHEIPIWLATSKTFTLYRSVLLLLSAENVYSMIFLPSSLLSIAIQPFGSSLDFLRCSPLSLRPHASSTHDEKLTLGLSSFSRSTLASIWSISAWGKRIPFVADLLFLALVAMKRSPLSVMTPYTNFERKKRVDVPQHFALMCPNTLIILGAKKATPQSATNTAEASIHNVNEAYTMEYSHSTQTHPKFQYLFLAVNRSDLNAKPHRESVTAHSEQDARRSLSGQFVLSFAGRLPEVSHGA